MKSFAVQNFGPIREAKIQFGDLTVLVGPQASGKSLLVQLYKAVKDAGAIHFDLKNYGFEWNHGKNRVQNYCATYFGSGLESVVKEDTVIRDGKQEVDFSALAKPSTERKTAESVFLVPAQRVLALQDGWPRPFMAYSEGDPYYLRCFSERLRLFVERSIAHKRELPTPFFRELRSLIQESIYVGAHLGVDMTSPRKRIILAESGHHLTLPFSVWSAGQREFTPLLLALNSLFPIIKYRGKLLGPSIIIIEEPEMGLHPQAIVSFGLLALELLNRGLRVVISTHSPVILDLVWAIAELKALQNDRVACSALGQVFGLRRLSKQVQELFRSTLTRDFRTYYFEKQAAGVVVKDISSLDPGADDSAIAGWGGLSGFSGRIADIVGRAIQEGA